MSGQSDRGINLLPDLYGFYTGSIRVLYGFYTGSLEFGFKLFLVVFLEKYANFIHRQGATDYKVYG